jgi:uncharacterized membrane protein YccC
MTIGSRIVMLCVAGILQAVASWTAAAGDQPRTSTTDKMAQDTKEALEATKQYTLRQKEAFQKNVQEELNELQRKIAALQKKTDAATVEARKDMQKAIQDLEKKKDEARKKLEEVNESTSLAWTTLKDGMTAAVEDLKKSYKEAVSKLP